MDKRNRSSLITLVLLALACSALPAPAQVSNIPQFSADTIMKSQGGESTQGKIYFGGSKIRMDMNTGGHGMQMITDIPKKASYMIMPQQRMYMEMNATMAGARGHVPEVKPVDPNNPCANDPGVTCKKLGTETVNGRTCDKWEFTSQHGKHTTWVDQKLHFPVKSVSSDGSTMEMTNIKEGTQPASLFQVPAGYQKMDMGGMMRQGPQD